MSRQICNNEPADFTMLVPTSIAEAATLSAHYGDQAAVLAGGCDLLDQMKHHWRNSKYLINLKSIAELKGTKKSRSEIQIGALTTLGEIERDGDILNHIPALNLATVRVASPQLRNIATVGGNLLQDSRCPYYRGGFNCYRAGGMTCDAHHGLNAEHAIFGGDRCYTVTASDLAPVLVALDAMVTLQGPQGLRHLPLNDLYLTPAENIRRMTRLKPGEILTALQVPLRSHQRSTFVKYAIRQSWDFAIVSVSVSIISSNGICQDPRIVIGAVAPYPWRSVAAERQIGGQKLTTALIESAADAAIQGATALQQNEYKIPLTKALVRQALTRVA